MRNHERSGRNQQRIGVVSCDSALAVGLRSLPSEPEVEEFGDLFADASALAAYQPDLLVLQPSNRFDQDLGGIRVLRALIPDLAVVVICAEDPVPDPIRRGCEAQGLVLVDPRQGSAEFARIVEEAITGQAETDDYLQFVQGISDEINNPLLFASGHLQLLASRIDPTDPGQVQIAAIRQGLERIRATMQKVSVMGRATPRRCARVTLTLGQVLDATTGRVENAGLKVGIESPPASRDTVLRGDPELLASALFGLCQIGAELDPEAAHPVVLVADPPQADAVELSMCLRNPRLESWELPRAFEPYQVNEILRGTSCGLNLFVLRLVTRAHGWDATVRRLPDRSVEFRVRAAAGASGDPSLGD